MEKANKEQRPHIEMGKADDKEEERRRRLNLQGIPKSIG